MLTVELLTNIWQLELKVRNIKLVNKLKLIWTYGLELWDAANCSIEKSSRLSIRYSQDNNI